MSLEDDAKKWIRDKRIENKRVLPADAAANALKAVKEELLDYLTGRKPLHPESMLKICNRGLAA